MANKKTYSIKTKYGVFDAVIWFSARENVYFVSVPAFSSVLTEARTLAEAKKYAGEVIALECLSAFDNGKIVIDDMKRVHGKMVRSGALHVVA